MTNAAEIAAHVRRRVDQLDWHDLVDHPLPETIAALRSSFYPHLAPVANRWAQLLSGDNPTFPLEHDVLLARCREVGQTRPTPLILRYGEGDWNALHQDLDGHTPRRGHRDRRTADRSRRDLPRRALTWRRRHPARGGGGCG
jgi:hypothetical protein